MFQMNNGNRSLCRVNGGFLGKCENQVLTCFRRYINQTKNKEYIRTLKLYFFKIKQKKTTKKKR